MGNYFMSDFVIDSKEHCFFSMDKILLPEATFDKDVFNSELNHVQSLQYLSRFLRMDMRKVFIEKGYIPPHLIAKVEMSRLKAKLCARCASLNETFSKLCRRLQKIEMEVMSSLELIHSELLKTERPIEYQILRNPTEHVEDEWTAKIGILDVVRNEAIRKCSTTIQKRRPRVRMSNLTEIDIIKIKENYAHNSSWRIKSDIGSPTSSYNGGIKVEQDEMISNPSFADQDHESDYGSEIGSPPSATYYEEKVIAKSDHEKSTPGTKKPHVNRWSSDPRIRKNIETIKLTDKQSAPKVRCRLCQKIFAHRINAARHVKTVHLKVKSFQCPQCFKMFSHKQTMETHMRIHSGLKPYKCDVCSKKYFQVAHLTRHLLVHTGRRPHKCNVCGNAYFQRGDLTTHRRHARH